MRHASLGLVASKSIFLATCTLTRPGFAHLLPRLDLHGIHGSRGIVAMQDGCREDRRCNSDPSSAGAPPSCPLMDAVIDGTCAMEPHCSEFRLLDGDRPGSLLGPGLVDHYVSSCVTRLLFALFLLVVRDTLHIVDSGCYFASPL
jgi:hypothetical protein